MISLIRCFIHGNRPNSLDLFKLTCTEGGCLYCLHIQHHQHYHHYGVTRIAFIPAQAT